MFKGKFIVIDGTDGSGKKTQWQLLMKRLKKEKIPFQKVDFPYYPGFFGQFLTRYLHGEFGDPTGFDPYFSTFPYALDRLMFKERIQKALKSGKIVVANRYVPSNLIHQGAKFSDKVKQKDFIAWVKKMEYEILGLPVPDLVFYLWVPAKVSHGLMVGRNNQKRTFDKQERNIKYQNRVTKFALSLAKREKGWKILECFKNNQLLSKKDIANQIWKKVRKIV